MQKIRMLFILFISIPLILGYATHNNFNTVVDDIKEKLEDFETKENYEQDEILKELDDSILELNEEIKNYTSLKEEFPDDDIVDLIKKLLEIINYLPWRITSMTNGGGDLKRKIMNDVLGVVEDHFGECSVAIEHITTLTKDINMNLLILSLLIEKIIKNKRYIQMSKRDIIKNLINCLLDRFNEYFPKIKAHFGKNTLMIKFFKKSHTENLRKYLSKLEGRKW